MRSSAAGTARCAAWAGKTRPRPQELTKRLQEAARRPDLAPLAQNPLQLAMMASLHFSWGRLPDDRVELYAEMVRLLLVRWQEARLGQETGVTATDQRGRPGVGAGAGRVRGAPQPRRAARARPTSARRCCSACSRITWAGVGIGPESLAAYIQDRAGLLMDRGNGPYTFPHRSYQEYLAGSYLAVQPDFPDETADLVRRQLCPMARGGAVGRGRDGPPEKDDPRRGGRGRGALPAGSAGRRRCRQRLAHGPSGRRGAAGDRPEGRAGPRAPPAGAGAGAALAGRAARAGRAGPRRARRGRPHARPAWATPAPASA